MAYGATGEGGQRPPARDSAIRAALAGLTAAFCLGLVLLSASWERLGSAPIETALLSQGDVDAAAWRKGLGIQLGDDDFESREKVLDKLRDEIIEEHRHIRRMHMQEHELLAKHAQVQAQVKHLMMTSHEATRDVRNLRNRYAQRVAEMEKEYRTEKSHLENEQEQSQQRIADLSSRENSLGVGVSRALATAQYYEMQREHADQRLLELERKAEAAAELAERSRHELDAARARTMDMQVKEAYAVSRRDANKLIKHENRRALRKVSRRRADLSAAHAQLTEETARAVAETSAAEEAKEEVQRAEMQKDEMERQLDDEKKLYEAEIVDMQHLEGRADMARDHTRLLRSRTAHAEEVLADLRTKEEDVVQESQDAIERVEKAEADAAVAKTQGAVVKSIASKDEQAAEEQVENVRLALKASKERLAASEADMRGMMHERDKALLEHAYQSSNVRHGEGRLEVANQWGHASRLRARLENKASKSKEQEAEGLLHSVGALAALARQAAKVAETARMKAETAAGIHDFGCEITGDFVGEGCGGRGAEHIKADTAKDDLLTPSSTGDSVKDDLVKPPGGTDETPSAEAGSEDASSSSAAVAPAATPASSE